MFDANADLGARLQRSRDAITSFLQVEKEERVEKKFWKEARKKLVAYVVLMASTAILYGLDKDIEIYLYENNLWRWTFSAILIIAAWISLQFFFLLTMALSVHLFPSNNAQFYFIVFVKNAYKLATISLTRYHWDKVLEFTEHNQWIFEKWLLFFSWMVVLNVVRHLIIMRVIGSLKNELYAAKVRAAQKNLAILEALSSMVDENEHSKLSEPKLQLFSNVFWDAMFASFHIKQKKVPKEDLEHAKDGKIEDTKDKIFKHQNKETKMSKRAWKMTKSIFEFAELARLPAANEEELRARADLVTHADFLIILGNEAVADEAFRLLSKPGSSSITRHQLEYYIKQLLREHESLKHNFASWSDINSVMSTIVTIGCALFSLVILMLVFEQSFDKVWVSSGAIILSLSFVFGNSIKTFFECMVFVLVMRPYDYGEKVRIGNLSNPNLEVMKISLSQTRFKTFRNQMYIVPNAALINQTIINLSRLKSTWLDISLQVAIETTSAQLKLLKKAMQQYCNSRPFEFMDSEISVVVEEITNGLSMRVVVWFQIAKQPSHFIPIHEIESSVMLHARDLMSQLNIKFYHPRALVHFDNEDYVTAPPAYVAGFPAEGDEGPDSRRTTSLMSGADIYNNKNFASNSNTLHATSSPAKKPVLGTANSEPQMLANSKTSGPPRSSKNQPFSFKAMSLKTLFHGNKTPSKTSPTNEGGAITLSANPTDLMLQLEEEARREADSMKLVNVSQRSVAAVEPLPTKKGTPPEPIAGSSEAVVGDGGGAVIGKQGGQPQTAAADEALFDLKT